MERAAVSSAAIRVGSRQETKPLRQPQLCQHSVNVHVDAAQHHLDRPLIRQTSQFLQRSGRARIDAQHGREAQDYLAYAGVDLLTRVADRQQAKSAWSTAKDKLECLEERLRLTLEDHARVLAEYGDKHVTVNEKQALARTKDSINQLEVEVESEKLLVERFAKEAA